MVEKLAGEISETSKDETYSRSYIGLPIKDSPLADWLKKLNPQKRFSHLTLHFLGEMSDEKLEVVKKAIISSSKILTNVVLVPKELSNIGIHRKTIVLKVENTPEITQLHDFFENSFPNSLNNTPFLPHITISKTSPNIHFARLQDLSNKIEPYIPHSIGVFYRTEENATALLFSHKI